jgi:superfamily II DNA or RNA helicase
MQVLDYQKKAIDFAVAHFRKYSGLLLKMDVGLGKTWVGVEVARRLKVKTCFVVPSSVFHQWKQHMPEGTLFVDQMGRLDVTAHQHQCILVSYYAMNDPMITDLVKDRLWMSLPTSRTRRRCGLSA